MSGSLKDGGQPGVRVIVFEDAGVVVSGHSAGDGSALAHSHAVAPSSPFKNERGIGPGPAKGGASQRRMHHLADSQLVVQFHRLALVPGQQAVDAA